MAKNGHKKGQKKGQIWPFLMKNRQKNRQKNSHFCLFLTKKRQKNRQKKRQIWRKMVTKMVTIKKYRLTWKKSKTQHNLWKRLCINGFLDVGSCFETPHRPHIDPTWGGMMVDGGWLMVDGWGQRGSGSTEGNGFVEVDVGVYKKYFSVFVFFHKKFQKKIKC